jgi:hypothetical protein
MGDLTERRRVQTPEAGCCRCHCGRCEGWSWGIEDFNRMLMMFGNRESESRKDAPR